MNALTLRILTTAVAAGLTVGAAFAASDSTLTVTLPEAVALGNSTLAPGQYEVTELMKGAGNWFVFRSNTGEVVASMATKTVDPALDQKTEVVLSNEGGTLHVDKLFIAGENIGFQFPESK